MEQVTQRCWHRLRRMKMQSTLVAHQMIRALCVEAAYVTGTPWSQTARGHTLASSKYSGCRSFFMLHTPLRSRKLCAW